MRKRLLTIGLATLMAISITACGGNSKKDESKSTTTTAKKLTTEEKIKKLKGQPVDKTIKKRGMELNCYFQNIRTQTFVI